MGCALTDDGDRAGYARLSLWHSDPRLSWTPRPALPGGTEADVVVVGAGYTGLWTAYYLAREDPSLRIVVLEAEVAGFGASGRNGGWCSALFPVSPERLARLARHDGDPGREAALAQHREMRASVDEVGAVVDAERIDADYTKGGNIVLARSRAQWRRARSEVDHARAWGRGEDDLRLLDPAEATDRLNATRVLGATYTPDCAVIHPTRLVRGLAEVVERYGVRIHERTRVRSVEPGVARTDHGTIRAPIVLRATEAFSPELPGQRRSVVPIYSLIVATEPLSRAVWDQIGLARRETFSDHRHLVIYGQRTTDDRLVFGGRGAPYHFGSRTRPGFDRDEHVFGWLRNTLVDMLPVLATTRFTHAWGGAVGVARDWMASVGLDPQTGLGWAGGYVGDGVSTTNLAGRTLRDLVLGHDTELTRLPWVGHRSRRWEPEPLRWVGINAALKAMSLADAEELRTGRPSLIARAMAPLTGA